VPYVSFWTEPALIFALYYHMDLLTKHGHFKCKGKLRCFLFLPVKCLFFSTTGLIIMEG
jgi:hypothetical protein